MLTDPRNPCGFEWVMLTGYKAGYWSVETSQQPTSHHSSDARLSNLHPLWCQRLLRLEGVQLQQRPVCLCSGRLVPPLSQGRRCLSSVRQRFLGGGVRRSRPLRLLHRPPKGGASQAGLLAIDGPSGKFLLSLLLVPLSRTYRPVCYHVVLHHNLKGVSLTTLSSRQLWATQGLARCRPWTRLPGYVRGWMW